jgi:hypothetical protein
MKRNLAFTLIAATLSHCLVACTTGDPTDPNPDEPDAGVVEPDDASVMTEAQCSQMYQTYIDKNWRCAGSFTPQVCKLGATFEDGKCLVYCIEACTNAPTPETLNSGHFVCTTFSGATQDCTTVL